MKKKNFTRLFFLFFAGLTFSGLSAQDLSPWTDNPYGNEWIDYSKTYVRVGVPANGIYKLSFSALAARIKKVNEAQPTPAQIQLWHRGKEVAIISADNDWVVFYGEKNDGVSDGLMYRPGPEARLNKYVSLFSEEGSYFFTSSSNPLRKAPVSGTPVSATAEPYHLETFLKKYDDYEANGKREKQVFSFPTFTETSLLNNSYYEAANAWTSPGISPSQSLDAAIQLDKWKNDANVNPAIEVVVNGLGEGAHDIKVYCSSESGDIDTKLISSLLINSFGGLKANVALNAGQNISPSGLINLKIKSLSANANDLFGVSYYAVTYPRLTDIGGFVSKTFNFPATSNVSSLISLTNAVSDSKLYDITNPYQPVLINGAQYVSSTLNFEVARSADKSLALFVATPSYTIADLTSGIKNVDFEPVYSNNTAGISAKTANGAINPSAFNYLIITNNDSDPARAGERDLRDGAKAYARDFRRLAKGGGYSTIVMDIRTIYDQFNYGEPSAMAIRRFVDYMIKNGISEKHNLLLIGYSITLPTNIVKEMPGEVPSFGDPGSDVLLVCGLHNSPNPDVPAIPVGRINAFFKSELAVYRSKVEEYENQTASGTEASLSWRKNVVHLVGAKRKYELNDFKGIFSSVSPYVTQLVPDRQIELVSNDAIATSDENDAPRTPAPLPSVVNPGVGMIAYYGHGNQEGTIYNIQRASLEDYTVNNKYSFIYFNGCGVGNIFTARSTQMLSTDWLITPGKGSVIIFGNSYKSYVSPTKIYIDKLYQQIFLKTDQQRRTSGQILKDMGSITINGSVGGRVMADELEVANIHQTNLYGDPAVRILNTTPSSTLPVELVDFKASLLKEQVKLDWSTAWEKNNSYFIVERSYNAKVFESIGVVEGKGDVSTTTAYDFIDSKPGPGINYYRLKQIDKLSNQKEVNNGVISRVIAVNVPGTESLIVFPNPTSDLATIKINVPVALKSWILTDVKGKNVSQGGKSSVSLKNLAPGTYILEVSTQNGDVYRKNIVKQ